MANRRRLTAYSLVGQTSNQDRGFEQAGLQPASQPGERVTDEPTRGKTGGGGGAGAVGGGGINRNEDSGRFVELSVSTLSVFRRWRDFRDCSPGRQLGDAAARLYLTA